MTVNYHFMLSMFVKILAVFVLPYGLAFFESAQWIR